MLPKQVWGSLPSIQNRDDMVISATEKAYQCNRTSGGKVCKTDLITEQISERIDLKQTILQLSLVF